jgi:hypothetical protein
MVEMAWVYWNYLMSLAFTSHHGQNIAGNALCVERGATISVSSVIASSCASQRVALRGGIPPVVEVIFHLLSSTIICLKIFFSIPFFSFIFFLSKNTVYQVYILIFSFFFFQTFPNLKIFHKYIYI